MISCVWFYDLWVQKEKGGEDCPDKLQGLFTNLIKSPQGPTAFDTHRHLKATKSTASHFSWQLLIKPRVDWCSARAFAQIELDGLMPSDVIMQMFVYLSNR